VSGESRTYDSVDSGAQLIRLAKALPEFDVAGALARLGGNIAIFNELLPSFHKNLVAAVSELRQLIRDGGTDEALIRLHGLKGVSWNLGATALSRVFQNMEQALATSREDQYEMLINRMEQTIHRNLAVIGAFLDAETLPDSGLPPPEAENADLLIETMKLLASLLDQGRLDAADCFMRLKSLLHHRHPSLEFNNLAAAMGCLDYANARKALTALAASMHIVL
jgi:two-component system, sensor histidine kinase and response regulator